MVSLEKGGEQSDGSLDVSGSTLKLGDDFSKTAGTLTTTIDGTTLELAGNLTLTSDTSLGVKTLNSNDKILTLGSESTDLTVNDPITMNDADHQIRTNSADLTLNGLLTVANGTVDSDNGTVTFNGGLTQSGGLLNINGTVLVLGADVNKSSGTLQTLTSSVNVSSNLTISSDSVLSVATINIGANTLSLGSESSDLLITDKLSLAEIGRAHV